MGIIWGDFLKRMIGIRLVVVRILYFVLVCVVSRAVWPHFERWVRDSPTVEGVIRHRIQWTCGFFLNKKNDKDVHFMLRYSR